MTDRAAAVAALRQAVVKTIGYFETVYATKATSADEDYDVIRADLVDRIETAFMDFVSQAGAVTSFRNAAGRALIEDIDAAFHRGYRDAGGEETEDDDEAWVTAKQSEQRGFMADAFESLKEWRASEKFTEGDIQARAELWGGMLDGVYSEGKLRGASNVMLTFDGEDGTESCDDCQRLKGQRHSAKWWTKRDLVRRNGNENYACGRWKNCQHGFYTDDGELYAP